MDVGGSFPASKRNSKYTLIMAMNYFNKWPEILPVPVQVPKVVELVFIKGLIALL